MRTSTKLLALTCLILASAAGGGQRASNPPILPDPKLTPGDALDVTKADICVSGYSKKVRNVPQAVKEQAYKLYGITHRDPGEYEVDHLISLELGGSNSIKNLWPESFKTQPWNAHVKDALENKFHADVCSGKIDLKVAQQAIAKDWIAAYKKYMPNPEPGEHGSHTPSTGGYGNPTAATNGQVWVNLNSGVYWRPGTQYYGKTKKGKYMSEQDAIKAGYRAAKGQ